MGLDIYRDTDRGLRASWSYGGFHDFSVRLAAAVGINLDTMHGFAKQRPGESFVAFARRCDAGTPWPASDDPIHRLINHSDCDGEIVAADCRPIAARLREIVAGWPEDLGDGGYDKMMALRLAAIMDAAGNAGEAVKFR